MYGLPRITIFGNEWGDSPMIVASDTVISENDWWISLRVTKISLFVASHILFYFLHAIPCFEQVRTWWKQTPIVHFIIVAKGGLL